MPGKKNSSPQRPGDYRFATGKKPCYFSPVAGILWEVMSRLVPVAEGYSMPAEWERHEATWVSWPHPGGSSFPAAYERVIPVFVEMVETLAESEIVRINVRDTEQMAEVRRLLQGDMGKRVEFFEVPTDEPWCRDHGPIFLRRKQKPRIAAANFGFNAWGYKLSPFENDDAAATLIARKIGVPLFDFGEFVLEGGSVDVNGQGTVLTTESCLLNPNRNPDMSREQIEATLRDTLGVRQVLWLGDGIEGDDTDGHVDDITRFVDPNTVVTVVEEDEEDPNYEPLELNYRRLRSMRLSNGSPLRVLKLPMPSRITRNGLRLPASYANFYIANSVVLLPAYHDTNDAWAASILREAFPGRKIVSIDCRELIWGLGAFHCLTQQQPAA
jgi:agmatine deiminase